ncbi:hypothetical protein MLOOGBEN_02220 [Bacillus sp. EB106-08-02-XG196]|uniref:hypothetical protein n=1 Tax=Bacillus sp. EB106-08-02-XG196 TaxID=2737049 RepID=UPI0015C41590|nr:hypothetical protein [Bacillus sp. EB106-08-02-XG196]NWQ39512.1 hypothetical protein [Bacillus sp. EB106-08-02-XG196]
MSNFYVKNNKEYVIESFKAVLDSNQNALKDEGLAFILNTLEHYQNQSVFHALWKLIEDHESIYKYVLEFIHQQQDYSNLLKLILENKFNLTQVEDILSEINNLLETAPYLRKNRCFQVLAIQKTADAVGNSTDPYKAACAVQAFNVTNLEVDFSKIKDKMMVYAEIALVDDLELQNMTLKDIDAFALLSTGKLTEIELKDKKIISKYQILKVLHELFTKPVVSVGMIVQRLSPANREELREVLKNVLRSNLSEKYFQHILAAFDNEEDSYHYPQLFGYLSKHADDERMLSFIKWSASNLQPDHHYHRALKAYLKTHPRSIWKNKDAKKELQMISTVSFRRLVKEVQNETASPVVKFLKRYGGHVSIVLLSTLVVGSGIYLGYDVLFDENEKTAFSKTNKPAVPVEMEMSEKTSLEPFKRWDAGNPYVLTVNGEQQKITFGQANPTGGKSLVLTGGQNIETPFDLVMDLEASPFDEKGVLKEGFSLYHTEHDFDKNGTHELVIMALSQTYESFVWVYSPISENGIAGLRSDLAINGMSDAKLVDNTLTLLGGEGQSETYAFVNQQFVKK